MSHDTLEATNVAEPPPSETRLVAKTSKGRPSSSLASFAASAFALGSSQRLPSTLLGLQVTLSEAQQP